MTSFLNHFATVCFTFFTRPMNPEPITTLPVHNLHQQNRCSPLHCHPNAVDTIIQVEEPQIGPRGVARFA